MVKTARADTKETQATKTQKTAKPANAGRNVPDPRTAIIRISLKGGKVTVDNDSVRIRAGGLLTFKIDPNDQTLTSFVVLMTRGTPFGSGQGWAGGEKGPGVKMRIDGSANDPEGEDPTGEATYSYCVMASDGTKNYSMDPDVIVGPPRAT